MRKLETFCWVMALLCIAPLASAWGMRGLMALAVEPSGRLAGLPGPVSASSQPAQRALEPPADAPAHGPAPAKAVRLAFESDAHAMEGDALRNWSAKRRRALAQFIRRAAQSPAAVLHLPSVARSIPVFDRVDEYTMTVGAGHLPDSDGLGSDGNVALTAHRDGTFRVLANLRHGDVVGLEHGGVIRHFVVRRTMIVAPHQVEVLDRTAVPTLTLITCYPFWFVGSAPQRYVLQAELANRNETSRAIDVAVAAKEDES